jgi:glycosyltransferase involved in cell wall biosynthesis
MTDDAEERALRRMNERLDEYEHICRGCSLFMTKECCGCPSIQKTPYLHLEYCRHGHWDKRSTTTKGSIMNKLTIGMATYDDYDGVYFSIQALRMSQYRHMIHEIIVIDNNPDSKQGKATAELVRSKIGCRAKYIPYTEKKSTSIRSKIFEAATGDYVLVMDCHVLLDPLGAPLMLKFLNQPATDDLIHGVLLSDSLDNLASEMKEGWNDKFYGQWYCRPNIKVSDDPFEIRMHGLGLFMAKRTSWLGFNPLFRGWGGEEGYIHEKYRTHGRKVICLPFLRWLHRFARPNGIPYTFDYRDRVFNYTVGWAEVGMNLTEMRKHFEQHYPVQVVRDTMNEALVASGKQPLTFE